MDKHDELTFQLMVEASPNALVLVNQNRKIAYINSFAERLFIYSKSEIIGKDVEILIPKNLQTIHPSYVNSYLENPVSRQMGANRELLAIKKDGTEIPVEIGLNPIVTIDGTMVLASIIDISERIRINEEKKKVAEQFRLVVEQAPNAIILVNSSGEISLVNKQTEKLFGFSRNELIGKEIELLLPNRFKLNHAKLREIYLSNPQSRQMGVGRELFAIKKDGSEFPVEIGLSPISLENGIGILTSIIDITERRKAEELRQLHMTKIENKNKELEQFIYIASHDLRAPIQSISSCSQLLIEDSAFEQNEVAKTSLNFIKKAASRMKELIDGLLDYGHIGKNSEIAEVDFNKILKAVTDDLSYDIKKSNAKITVEELPTLEAYETEIRLLFQNLLANAIKFQKPNIDPEIFITFEKHKGYWKFNVKDNGIGISPNHKEKIFIIFQRLHGQDVYKGTGIGLSHCRKIVELYNGKIGVDSELGKGSTFYFTINKNLN